MMMMNNNKVKRCARPFPVLFCAELLYFFELDDGNNNNNKGSFR